ncbi:hypothetical protein KIS4809_3403 [Bacillus sp. ZZV12-4809]|nr:hypothetical protein KIS4809_3403 [Bacillus sp. ZZV12-4809]
MEWFIFHEKFTSFLFLLPNYTLKKTYFFRKIKKYLFIFL